MEDCTILFCFCKEIDYTIFSMFMQNLPIFFHNKNLIFFLVFLLFLPLSKKHIGDTVLSKIYFYTLYLIKNIQKIGV